MVVLTVAEIIDLAKFAGLRIEPNATIDADDLKTEIVVDKLDGVVNEKGAALSYRHIAYLSERPEEGCYPLGGVGKGDAQRGGST